MTPLGGPGPGNRTIIHFFIAHQKFIVSMRSLRPPMGMFTRDVPFVLYHAAYGGAEYSGNSDGCATLTPEGKTQTHAHW